MPLLKLACAAHGRHSCARSHVVTVMCIVDLHMPSHRWTTQLPAVCTPSPFSRRVLARSRLASGTLVAHCHLFGPHVVVSPHMSSSLPHTQHHCSTCAARLVMDKARTSGRQPKWHAHKYRLGNFRSRLRRFLLQTQHTSFHSPTQHTKMRIKRGGRWRATCSTASR